MAGEIRRVGLLFVHGVGEQKRFEHLRASVLEIAEWARVAFPTHSVSVVDRTTDWPHPAGRPAATGPAPVTLFLRKGDGTTRYDCHEVWWADLGKRASIGETVRFWTWGFGQWATPLYRSLDLSGAARAGPDEPTTVLPRERDWSFRAEVGTRLRLAFAALVALFSLVSWSLIKRVLAFVTRSSPGPNLIVQYLGDVEAFEQKARPNCSALSDPGHPLRVGIRRRMVTEMVAMGARAWADELDEWCVVAHSLGTVLAYNGLTEFGHTLPNYLEPEQWAALPEPLKRDAGTKKRSAVHEMMPSRPAWLDDQDIIDRRRLFAKLSRVLTYGSPLDKFAALWPRIIATGDDRADGGSAFKPDTAWVNVAAPNDPVSGWLDAFEGQEPDDPLNRIKPVPRNMMLPLSAWPGLAHIHYLRRVPKRETAAMPSPRHATVAWMLGMGPEPRRKHRLSEYLIGFVQYLALAALLYLLTVTLIWAAVSALGKDDIASWWAWWREGVGRLWSVTAGGAMTIVAAAGSLHWARDAIPNAAKPDSELSDDPERRRLLRFWLRLLAGLSGLSLICGLVALTVLGCDVATLALSPAQFVSSPARLCALTPYALDWTADRGVAASMFVGPTCILLGAIGHAVIAKLATRSLMPRPPR